MTETTLRLHRGEQALRNALYRRDGHLPRRAFEHREGL